MLRSTQLTAFPETNKKAVEILHDLGITPSGGQSIDTSVKDIVNWYLRFQVCRQASSFVVEFKMLIDCRLASNSPPPPVPAVHCDEELCGW